MRNAVSKNLEKPDFFTRLATVIVDKRNLMFFLYFCAAIFCLFSRNWVSVCSDITQYLPETTETRQGLTIMERASLPPLWGAVWEARRKTNRRPPRTWTPTVGAAVFSSP